MANNSFTDCLAAAGFQFKGSEKAREEALRDFDAAYTNEKRAGKSDFEAMGNAAQRLVDRQKFEASSKANAVLRALDARQKMEQAIQKSGKRPVQGIIDELYKTNADIDRKSSEMLAQMADFFQRYTTGETLFNKTLGGLFTDTKDRDLFGRAKFGEDVQSLEHKRLADQVSAVEEAARIRANNAGAAIRQKKRYGVSTEHDAAAIQKAGKVKWINKISNLIDLNHSYDGNGRGLATLKPEELQKFYSEAYDAVTSDGLAKSPMESSGALASSMQQTRHFEFKDYDSWKSYNRDFGMSHGDPVNAVESNLAGMSRDIAMIEHFGPNPKATIKYAKNFALTEAAKQKAAIEDIRTAPQGFKEKHFGDITKNAQRDVVRLDGMVNELMGEKNPMTLAGATYGTLRNIVVYPPITAKAFIAQMTGDVLGRQANMRLINGLPMMGMLHGTLNWMKGMTSEERTQFALRMGFGTQDMLKSLRSTTFSREHPIYSFSQSLGAGVGRAFLVHHHMQSLPRTMAMEISGFMAQHRNLDFDALAKKLPAFAESMKRNDITPEDWEIFRKVPVTTFKGAEFLSPIDSLNSGNLEVGKKFGAFINSQARETVPASNPSTRYALYGTVNPNSFPGMILRDSMTALYFGASTFQMLTHGFLLRQGVASRTKYIGAMAVALAVATAAQLQFKAILAGRDPYDMNPENETGRNFWSQVALRSSFGGPAYDAVMGSEPGGVQHGKGVIGKVADTMAILKGGVDNEINGKEPKASVGAKLFKLYRDSLPGADGWYTQAIVQHAMLDALQREVDPNAYAEWQRSQNFYRRNYGQESWWGRGSMLPDRAPDLSTGWQNQ